MSPTALSGAWWEGRPRGLVDLAKNTAASQLRIRSGAPPGMTHYQDDPIGFMVEELGIKYESLVWSANPGYENHVWDGTPDPIATWARALADGKDVAVESATGQGKSFMLALTKLWFLAAFQGARCFDFAEKLDQLEEFSWVELEKLWPRFKLLFPRADKTTLKIRMDGRVREGELSGWGAVGRGYQKGSEDEISGGGQGMHAAHMLISIEEAANVPLSLTRAIENTVGGVHNIRQMVGNPNSQDDALHRFATEPGVVHIRISALDHPNVVVNAARDPEWKDVGNDVDIVPGASGRNWLRRQRHRYDPDNWIYQSRVRGISPPQHVHALIRRQWLEDAYERWQTKELRVGLPGLGADVARSTDGDGAALAYGVGPHLDEVPKFACDNVTQLGIRIALMMQTREIAVRNVGVDVGGGYGGGTADKLKELGLYVIQFNGGSKAEPHVDETLLDEDGKGVLESALHRNLRSQAYWRLAMDLQLGRLALPYDEELWEDLMAVRWEPKLGKVVVEEKPNVVERLGRSPDKGDAVVIWNWVRERFSEEEEDTYGAWDADILEHEAREGRRVRTKPPARTDGVSPTIIERV